MARYIFASILTGLLFGTMDGIIYGNNYGKRLLDCYNPIAKQSVNVPAGIVIDLVYGFIISGIYIIIMPALPTEIGIIKGLTYGAGIWFFRVFMGVVSNWMMYKVPVETLVYLLVTGLIELLILGILNGLIIK